MFSYSLFFNHLDAVSVPNDVEVMVNLNPVVSVNNIAGVLEASGNYTVKAINTEGCSVFSDPVLAVGIQEQLTTNPAISSIKAFDLVGRFLGQFRNQEELVNQKWNGNQLLLLQYFDADQNLIGTEGKLTSVF
ncbi:MAG: hypothetical protein ACJAVL_000800 [Bacteroidia bacterium]